MKGYRKRVPGCRSPGRLLLLLAAIGATAGVSGEALAKKTAPKPLVLLLLDTSGSMEYSATATMAEQLPVCHNVRQAGFAYEKSRWAVTVEVLTGTFNDYWCSYDWRNDDNKREDYQYYIPHVEPKGVASGGQVQREDGLLDLYRDTIKFAAMAFDPIPDASDMAKGGYSYGPDKGTGGNKVNLGARNSEAPWGAFVAPTPSEQVVPMRNVANEVEQQILLARPYHGTPIAPLLEDALYFYENDTKVKEPKNESSDGDQYYSCRSKTAILITDGAPNMGEGTDGYGYSETAAAKLLARGVRVYVVGFQLPFVDVPAVNKIAQKGGTQAAHLVSNQAELAATLGKILVEVQGNQPAGTEAIASTTRTMNLDDAQYQFGVSYGGTSKTPLDMTGQLDQFVFRCDPDCEPEGWTGGASLCEVFSLSDSLNGREEPRNVYTQIAGSLLEFKAEQADITADMLAVPKQGDLPLLVPAVTEAGQKVFTGLLLGSAANPEVRAEYRNQLMGLVRADAGSRREEVKMGAVVHSQPVLQPNLFTVFSRIPSFTVYQNEEEIRKRPTALFVGTHDGQLHAFRVDRHADLAEDSYGEEMWAFIPKHLLLQLNRLASGMAYLLDGQPVVQEVRLYKDEPLVPIEDEVDRWRSVLVTGYRDGGRGYFALDVTDPEEFKFMWEVSNTERCWNQEGAFAGCMATAAFAKLGKSYSTPAVGIVFASFSGTLQERSVAIFGGGESVEGEPASGLSMYVVDLRTGEVIREFCNGCGNVIDSNPVAENNDFLDCPLVGPVAAHDASIGGVITRAYIGDACGQLWRLDLSAADPDDWKLEFFHDAFAPKAMKHGYRRRIALKPALATGFDPGRLVVLYGTGDPDSVPEVNRKDNIFSLTEYWNGSGFEARVNWELALSKNETLTSTPVVFSQVAYFTTQAAGKGLCAVGHGRLWGLDFDGLPEADSSNVADVLPGLDKDGCPLTSDVVQYVEYANSDCVGIQVMQRPACFAKPTDFEPWNSGISTGASVPAAGAGAPKKAGSGIQFAGSSGGSLELVVQTGQTGVSSPSMMPPEGGGTVQTGNQAVQKLLPPRQSVFSNSWGLVFD